MTTLSACCHLLPNRGIVGSGAVDSCKEQVLRFFCEFEVHRRSMGRKASVMLLYYTRDDSIELRQLPAGACVQDALARHSYCATLMKRQRVAKPTWQPPVSAEAGGLRPCRPTEGFYHWSDIVVGRPIQILGFHLLVSEADAATTAFYESQERAQHPVHLEPASAGIVQSSLTRSASTLPTQFLNYTSRGTPAMRFTASMVSAPNFECTGCDMKRHFVLSFYVEDNSLSIAEPPNKETLTGGECFFPRQHASKPCLHSPYSTDGAYEHKDLYLGALVPVLLKARRGFEAEGPKMFQLLTADDWTLDFMAARPQDWPCADEAKVLEKIRSELEVDGRGANVAQLLAEDCSSTAEEQRSSLCVKLSSAGCQVNLHECVTLLRHLSGGSPVVVPTSAITALLHLPEPVLENTSHRTHDMHTQSTRAGSLRQQLATTAVRTLPRPHTAIGTQSVPSKSRPTGKDQTSYGASFSRNIQSARPMHRIGAHIFGNNPEHDPYYNRTEHGTYLLREAISQKPGKAPSWA